MLQISFIRQHTELVKERLSIRHYSGIAIVDRVVELDEQVRNLKVAAETLQAEMNLSSKEIGVLMGKGEKELAEQKKQEVAPAGRQVDQLTGDLARPVGAWDG